VSALTVNAHRALALLIAAGFVTEQAVYAARGIWSAEVNLPLQLIDAVTLVSIAALLRPDKPLLVELTYFWALSASLQPLTDAGKDLIDGVTAAHLAHQASLLEALSAAEQRDLAALLRKLLLSLD
jgi:uncharacterized membrane protein YwaF